VERTTLPRIPARFGSRSGSTTGAFSFRRASCRAIGSLETGGPVGPDPLSALGSVRGTLARPWSEALDPTTPGAASGGAPRVFVGSTFAVCSMFGGDSSDSGYCRLLRK